MTATMVPPVPIMTTEYWVLSLRPGTSRRSIRRARPDVMKWPLKSAFDRMATARRNVDDFGPTAVVRIDGLVAACGELGNDRGLAGSGHAGQKYALHVG